MRFSICLNLDRKSATRQALPQILAVSAKNLLLLAFGMTLGFPTILIPGLSGGNPHENISLGAEAISWIGSINLICVPLGCMLSGSITQAIGRRRAMQLANIPLLIAWLLFHFSQEAWQVFLALAITGFTGGLLEAPTLTYVAEITQPYLRGILSSLSGMSVTFGVLTQFLLGTFMTWRSVVLVNCSIPLISLISLLFIPETPIWLIRKDRLEEAKESIAWLRGWTTVEDIKDEYQELYKHIRTNSDNSNIQGEKSPTPSKIESLKLFAKKSFLWPFMLISFVFLLSHFNGQTVLATYAIKIFSTLKAPIDKYYATVIMGTVQLLGCFICVVLIHVLGKRIIAFVSLLGSGLCFIIVATYAYCHEIFYLHISVLQNNETYVSPNVNVGNIDSASETYSWVPVVFLVISAFFNYLGTRGLPWVLIGEVYSNETRATASGLSGAVGYIFGFAASKTFLNTVSAFTLPGIFWFNGCVSFIGIIILYFVLPETEGKTLFEITEHFSSRSKLGNSVRKGRDTKVGQGNPTFVLEDKNKKIESRL